MEVRKEKSGGERSLTPAMHDRRKVGTETFASRRPQIAAEEEKKGGGQILTGGMQLKKGRPFANTLLVNDESKKQSDGQKECNGRTCKEESDWRPKRYAPYKKIREGEIDSAIERREGTHRTRTTGTKEGGEGGQALVEILELQI